MKKIIVLMSTYNGELYLEEQLQSIINQKFVDNSYTVEILVRDDGSKDRTIDILKKYKKKGLLNYYAGENIGWQKSYWHLLKYANDADYYAFSDQDDVWFSDKLSRAVERLLHEGDIPLLYFSDTIRTDKDLHPLKEKKRKPLNFPSISLMVWPPQGCTSVFNCTARRHMIEYDMEKYHVEAHDALAGQIISLLGKVIYDKQPSMFYRIHEQNTIAGTKQREFIKRTWRFLSDWEHITSKCAGDLEKVYQDGLAGNSNIHYLHEVAHYRENISNTLRFLNDKAFRIGEFKHDLFLFIKILARKL